MGKKNKSTSLGRALIKDRFSSKKPNKGSDSMLHTAELNDGYDWGRLNLQSVTEQSSFEEFLSTAELAGTEFQAEKLNVTFINSKIPAGVLTSDQRKQFEATKEQKKELLRIPRRPLWDASTTPDELLKRERESFLEWRRGLAALQDQGGLTLTPYEKNLDFWRQLWRVIERSDVVVQILDARNPLLFRCQDLEAYVKEVSPAKENLLLLNKADFLTVEQRKAWAAHFAASAVRALFFSATQAAEAADKDGEGGGDKEGDDEAASSEDEIEEAVIHGDKIQEAVILDDDEIQEAVIHEASPAPEEGWSVLSREGLLRALEGYAEARGATTIGFVGYPNVGKSSTINALVGAKKVSMSATPGKTKHFQTLVVNRKVTLCDCPGLVMPTLVASKADMVLAGILPIDQMKEHAAPTALLVSLIPSRVLQLEYSVLLPDQLEYQQLLDSYAYSRGFMTQNGQPDSARASRYILKDFVRGRLLHCVAPPSTDQGAYHSHARLLEDIPPPPAPTPHAVRATQGVSVCGEDLDRAFFHKVSLGAHSKGVLKFTAPDPNSFSAQEPGGARKPWKDHSAKRNKKEKLRRVYRHLDLV